MRFAVSLVVVWIMAAAPAAAQAPAAGAVLERDLPVTFEVDAPADARWVIVEVTTPSGRRQALVRRWHAEPGDGAWTAVIGRGELVTRRPGLYAWRATIAAADGSRRLTPLRRFTVVPPVRSQRREDVPRRFGARRRSRVLYVSTRGIPSGVPRTRFGSIVVSAAARWGLRVGGWVKLHAGAPEGHSVIGFAALPPRLNGADRRRSQRRGSGPWRLVDEDVLLNRDRPWFAGPGYPDAASMDLESVVLHELGHFAGNHGHVGRCTGSPLTATGGLGEWWRGPDDWWQWGCPNGGRPLGRPRPT